MRLICIAERQGEMASMDSVGTFVRGADGVLYNVSADRGGQRAQVTVRDLGFSGAQAARPEGTCSDDHGASRMVIEADDHGASRMVIGP